MKIVREQLNEIKRGTSGLGGLGIGNTTIIKKWLDEKGVTNYTIHDNIIDVNGDVDLENKIDGILPDYIQFGTIYGDFNISDCNLLYLKGCPIKVIKNFNCSKNELEFLDFCPKFVHKNILIFDNKTKDFSEKEVKKYCNVKGRVFLDENEWFDSTYTLDYINSQ